jgi:hypothetical protein
VGDTTETCGTTTAAVADIVGSVEAGSIVDEYDVDAAAAAVAPGVDSAVADEAVAEDTS